MPDNYVSLEPTAAPSGTQLAEARAPEIGGKKHQAAILFHPVTGAALIGRAGSDDSLPVALSSEDLAKLEAIRALLTGSLTIGAVALPLPEGAATQTTLAAVLDALLGTLSATVGGSVAVTNLPATQPVSAAALPLPAGAATDATLASGVGLRADLDGTSQSGVWTLSATPGTVTSITLPDAARIVTVKPSADIQVRLNADPAAIGGGAFAAGSPVSASERRAFLVAAGASRTLRIRSTTASATVTVEWRP